MTITNADKTFARQIGIDLVDRDAVAAISSAVAERNAAVRMTVSMQGTIDTLRSNRDHYKRLWLIWMGASMLFAAAMLALAGAEWMGWV